MIIMYSIPYPVSPRPDFSLNKSVARMPFQAALSSAPGIRGMPIPSYLSIYESFCRKPEHIRSLSDAYAHCWTDILFRYIQRQKSQLIQQTQSRFQLIQQMRSLIQTMKQNRFMQTEHLQSRWSRCILKQWVRMSVI